MLRTGLYEKYFSRKIMKFNVNLTLVCGNNGGVPTN
jgi:hypothetical protein